jgi:ADP-ribosylglycohydrolase
VVVACWYIRNGLSAVDALAKLAQVRDGQDRTSPEVAAQFAFVHQWQEPTSVQATRWRQLRDRFRGALIGLAVGDALGTTLEFTEIGQPWFDRYGWRSFQFNLPAGGWTNDTSMALCLAQSLMHCQGFDAKDQIEHYVRWYREGYLSSTDRCFDIGNTVRSALKEFEQTGNPFAGATGPYTAGNGSLMRLAPIPMFYAGDDAQLVHYAGESSAGDPRRAGCHRCLCVDGDNDGYWHPEVGQEADIIPAALGYAQNHPMQPDIASVINGSYRHQPPIIQGTGYVVKSFEAALWAFYHFDDFKTGALAAVNLGQDADTTGAIYGQLAGAVWGESQIPLAWCQRLVKPRNKLAS